MARYTIDGHDGAHHWTGDGSFPSSPGDLDGDGRRDVVVRTIVHGGSAVGLDLHAYSSEGNTLWDATHRSAYEIPHCGESVCSFSTYSWLDSAGDVGGDGVDDTLVNHEFDYQAGVSAIRQFIDGASGRLVAGGGTDHHPLAAAIDGQGSDLVVFRPNGAGATVSAVTGDTGEPLWRARIQAVEDAFAEGVLRVEGHDLDGDGCAEVILSKAAEKRAHVIVLDGATGALKWWAGLAGQSLDLRSSSRVFAQTCA